MVFYTVRASSKVLIVSRDVTGGNKVTFLPNARQGETLVRQSPNPSILSRNSSEIAWQQLIPRTGREMARAFRNGADSPSVGISRRRAERERSMRYIISAAISERK